MGKENKSYRIRTNINSESVIHFSLDNTIDTFEILSLKIGQKNAYRLMGSNTGIVAGRILANGGFGVPNVKVSVFIEYEGGDNMVQNILYSYTSTKDYDANGIRYNLLPNEVDDDCHQNIGTFPSKRVLLDNNNWIEVFDKYYKFTTRTNDSGDYMIYGVPTGNQTVHIDVDLSDIGILSQKPRDLIYKGYDVNLFDSMTKFKTDTNLDSLAQVITQDQTIYVYPFWGDTTDNSVNASITRCDMNINYKFEPTCVFMGSVITDTGENTMSKKCIGAKKQGRMSEMITGEGKIEMIRKTPNGQVEQFSIKGDNNINSDGVWCYQIPMNLDYVKTDEFGKMVMSDDPNTGLPTRARVRFRLSMAESPSDASARKRARFLIPNNPHFIEEDYPNFCETKEIDYEFGTKTRDENFRDLFWNNVYTVKSYIPRLQKSRLPNNLRHLGIKMVNHSGSNNPMPFNSLRIKFNFIYTFLCTLVKVLVTVVSFINGVLTFIGNIFLRVGYSFFHLSKEINSSILGEYYFDGVAKLFAKYRGHGIKDADGLSPRDYLKKVWEDKIKGSDATGGLAKLFLNIFLAIGCGIELRGLCETDDGTEISVTPGTYDKVKNELREAEISTCNDRVDVLYNCIENQLAQDNEVTSFDFYNDWVNGVIYLPLWYRKIRKKRNGTIKKDQWCSTDNTTVLNRKYKKNLKLYATNVIKRSVSLPGPKDMGKITPLANNEQTAKSWANSETGIEMIRFTKYDDDNCYGYNCHKYARTYFKVYKGLIFEKETMLGDKVYYYKPCDYDQSTGNSDLVTLFATDLVLLGSLNDCDIHGIPQFFKALESTTYNMPPDLLSETYDYINEDNQTKPDNDDSEEIDLGSRMTEYTGADWGNLGVDQSNLNESTITFLGTTYYTDANENEYDNGGLFYGLGCFNSYTKPKSCINLSRICELGISLDESTDLPANENSARGTENDTVSLTPDGFVSYDEIYNPDYRSIFATLNANFLRTKLNTNTGLLEYDFNHVYIDNFDGSLKLLMMAKTVNGKTEQSDFQEKANYVNNYNLENSSDAYLNFRYGNYVKKNNNKIYFYENNNSVGFAYGNGVWTRINGKNRLPRYENSFYFYFGLNEGKTALDKFNTEFFSDCTNNFASDVPYDLTYNGNSWCPFDATDGYIAFNMNIDGPYTITFTNKEKNDVYYQTNINAQKILFYKSTSELPTPEGYEKYTIYSLNYRENNASGSDSVVDIIPNGTYDIVITDGYDNTYNDSLTFELPRLGFLCDVNPFSARNIEMLERFKYNDTDTIKDVYTNIANYGQFNDVEELKYTAYNKNDIINAGTVYYTKTSNNEWQSSIAATQLTVPQNDYWYFKHNPRLDRDINGYIGISEVTEYDFRIKLEPINTLFFGDNYIGASVDVHHTFVQIPAGQTIDTNEVYYTMVNGEYVKNINTGSQIVVSDDDEYYSAAITVSNPEYYLYATDDIINIGDVYYTKDANDNYTPHTQTGDVYVVTNDDEFYYHVDNCGYLGFYTFEGVTNFFFGVPYGNERYKLTITQLCDADGNWVESNNVSVINIIVYEDEFKMYLNEIDYDIISNFKTGWVDENLLKDGEFVKDDTTPVQYGHYDDTMVFGWNDVLNIGTYINGGVSTEIKNISYVLSTTENNIRNNIENMVNLSMALASSNEYNTSPYLWRDEYNYDAPSQNADDYFIGTITRVDYTYTIPYRFKIKDNVILYDGVGNIIEEGDMNISDTYYLDDEQSIIANGHAYDSQWESYDYTWMNWLYDTNGNIIQYNGIIKDETYYIDPDCTIEAVVSTNYLEQSSEAILDVMRINYKVVYEELGWNDYLFTGDVFYYRYGSQYMEDAVVSGYENGITVRDYSNLMYQGTMLYYKLEEPKYNATYTELAYPYTVFARESNDGDIEYHYSYSAGENVEYTDLDCMTLLEYRDIVDNINGTIDNRFDLSRKVAGAFRINDDETVLNVTTKTKAKPVRYLIAGSKEISASDLLYNRVPERNNITAADKVVLSKYSKMSLVENTKYTSLVGEKEISNGYVVDTSLETPNVAFKLPTLTIGPWFTEYNDGLNNTSHYNDRIKNGDQYYIDENGQYKLGIFRVTETVSSYKSSNETDGDYYKYNVGEIIYANTHYYVWNIMSRGYTEETMGNVDYVVQEGDEFYKKEVRTRYIPYIAGEIIPANSDYWTRTYTDYNTSAYHQGQPFSTDHIVQSTEDYYFKTPVSEDNKYYQKIGILYWPMTDNSSLTDGKEFYIKTNGAYELQTAKITSTVFDYKKVQRADSYYKKTETGDDKFIPYSKNGQMKHPYYVASMNGNESIIPPGKDISNFENLGNDKDLTKTFGVHFYNKPLTSDFKIILSYINGVPAYPKIVLGGDDIYGYIYKFNYKTYDIDRYTDDSVVLPDCTVYGTKSGDSRITFYRCNVLASENKTVGDIKIANSFNELYGDFLTQINPGTVSPSVYLYKGDIMFRHTQSPDPSDLSYKCIMDVIRQKRTLLSYVNQSSTATYFSPKTLSATHEVTCIEQTRVNTNENVIYYYYTPINVAPTPSAADFKPYTSPNSIIYAGWDYYTYEQNKFVIHAVSVDTLVGNLPSGTTYYYYDSYNWLAKRNKLDEELIYNNAFYFDGNEVLVDNSNTPHKYSGEPYDETKVELTYNESTGEYMHDVYVSYHVNEVIPAYSTYYILMNDVYIRRKTFDPITVLVENVYYRKDSAVYYGGVTDIGEISSGWKAVDVSMPGFMCGYLLNGTPKLGTGTGENIKHVNSSDVVDWDKSNITATLNETPLVLFTHGLSSYAAHPDVYENIRVERLLITNYSSNEHPVYGEFKLQSIPNYKYQYVEVPLIDDDLVYTDGYGDEYRYSVKGTTTVMFDNPNINQLNEGKTLAECRENQRADDYLKYRTFYISEDGYSRHQSTYYLFDLDYTEYPLYYYNDPDNPNSELNSNLKYDTDKEVYYFAEMPDLFRKLTSDDVEGTDCISISKSTQFNLSNYLRKKYNQQEGDSGESVPVEIRYPMDKFFVIGCCDNYYSISPVLETQKIRLIYNYNGFDNRQGDPIYITAQTARDYTSATTIYRKFNANEVIYKNDIYYERNSVTGEYISHKAPRDITVQSGENYYYSVKPISEGIHYVEDFYYLMHYRFTVHVALYDVEKFAYEDDMFSQVYSRLEGSAEYCYIRVDDQAETATHPITNWATALKINLSSLGTEAQDSTPGKINPWLQIMIEDASGGIRRTIGQASDLENPNHGVEITEFNSYEDMMADYESRNTTGNISPVRAN